MAVDPGRVAEIYATCVGRGGASTEVGSGYVLSPQLILTAAHVVGKLLSGDCADPSGVASPRELREGGDGHARCRVRPLGTDTFLPVRRVWADERLDVALLWSAEPLLADQLPALPWGRCAQGVEYGCEAVGFPVARKRGNLWDTHGLAARTVPHEKEKAGIAIRVEPTEQARLGDPRAWQGMSGAALIAGDHFLGVLRSVERGPRQVLTAQTAVRIKTWLGGLGVGGLEPIPKVELVPPEWAWFLGREPARRVYRIMGNLSPLVVGREDDLGRLDRHLDERPAEPLLVAGPAGHGKSALLAKWAELRRGQGDVVVAHFFSQQQGLTRLSDAWDGFCWQLEWAAEFRARPATRTMGGDDARLRFADLLERWPATSSRRLVVIIDGLDEAEEWFLPPVAGQPPERVTLVSSIRASAQVPSLELPAGWASDGTVQSVSVLDESAIGTWLASVGGGILSTLANNAHLRRRLTEATGGLPLYLQFLVSDLLGVAATGGDPAHVAEQVPEGFAAYVERELALLGRARGLSRAKVRKLFALATVATDPIPWDDIEALTGLRRDELLALPDRVQRWLVRSDEPALGLSYAFAHPTLAQEFARLLGTEADRQLERLLGRCAKWRTNGSGFALRSYGRQLRQAGRVDELYALAEDKRYAAAQSERFPARDEHPATLRVAIAAAVERADARRLIRLLLAHGRAIDELATQDPLDALRHGSLARALFLIRLHDPTDACLWSLLLAWELLASGRSDAARNALGAALELPADPLSEWEATLAGVLLLEANRLDREAARTLRQRFLDPSREAIARAALATLGSALAAAGDLEQAREIAELSDDRAVWLGIVRRQAADNIPETTWPAAEINRPDELACAKAAAARGADDAGRRQEATELFRSARTLARSLASTDTRDATLCEIVRLQADAGRVGSAFVTAVDIADPSWELDALLEIASAQARVGQNPTNTFRQMERLLGSDARGIEYRGRRLAEAWAAVGNTKRARQLLFAAWQVPQPYSPIQAGDRLNNNLLLEDLLVCGLNEEADELRTSTSADRVDQALYVAATRLARRGDLPAAEGLVEQITRPALRRLPLASLAARGQTVQQAQARDWAAAALLTGRTGIVDPLAYAYGRDSELEELAKVLAGQERTDLASTIASALDGDSRKAAYKAMARTRAAVLDPVGAEAYLHQASSKRPPAALVLAYARTGQGERARELLNDAESEEVAAVADAAAEAGDLELVLACATRLHTIIPEHADRVRGALAVCQSRSGAREAALQTLGSISDPRIAAATMSVLAAHADTDTVEALLSAIGRLPDEVAVPGLAEVASVLLRRRDKRHGLEALLAAGKRTLSLAKRPPSQPRAAVGSRPTDARRMDSAALVAAAAIVAILGTPETSKVLEGIAQRAPAPTGDEIIAHTVRRLAALDHLAEAKRWLRRVPSPFTRAQLVLDIEPLADDAELIYRTAEEIPSRSFAWVPLLAGLLTRRGLAKDFERVALLAARSWLGAVRLGHEVVRLYPDQASDVVSELLMQFESATGSEVQAYSSRSPAP
jgi:AAA ATPase domain/Trypsin-like peptidase domain